MRTVMIAALACAAFGLVHGHRDHAQEFQGHGLKDPKHHGHGVEQKPQGHEDQQEPAQAQEPLCTLMLKQMVAQEADDDFLPDCNDDGTFASRQCFKGDCYCADPLTGELSADLTACPVEDDDQEGSDQGSEGSDQGSEGSDQGSEGSDQGSEGSDQGSEDLEQGSDNNEEHEHRAHGDNEEHEHHAHGDNEEHEHRAHGDNEVVEQDSEVVDQGSDDTDEVTEGTEEAVVSACFEEHQDAVDAGLLGNFIPQCMEDGSYAPMQCHGSTGECWCADTLTGDQEDVDLAECQVCTLMHKALVAQEADDDFLPDCNDDGTFASRQCFKEDCYCADALTGELSTDLTACPVEEETTEDNEEATDANAETTEDNEEATDAAEQEENAQGSDDNEQTSEQGSEPAQAQGPLCSLMLKQMVAQEVDDDFLPDCNDDGTFASRQCFKGECYCADALTGELSADLTACPVEEETTEDNEEAAEDTEQVIGDDIATDDEDEDANEDEGFSMGPSVAGAAILGVAMVGIASFVVVKRRSQEPEASEYTMQV